MHQKLLGANTLLLQVLFASFPSKKLIDLKYGPNSGTNVDVVFFPSLQNKCSTYLTYLLAFAITSASIAHLG